MAVVIGVCRVGGKETDARPIPGEVLEILSTKVENRRHQDDAVEVHREGDLQPLRNTDGSDASIRLAKKIMRTSPAPVAGNPQPDEFADQFDVFTPAVPLVGIVSVNDAGVPRRHSVNNDEVCLAQQSLLVVDEVEGQVSRLLGSTGVDDMRPICNHTDEDPGPPLKTNVNGLASGLSPDRRLGLIPLEPWWEFRLPS